MKVKVSFFGLKDMLAFKHLSDRRKEWIDEGSTDPLPETYVPNTLAALFHPRVQHLRINRIIDEGGQVKTFVLGPDASEGTEQLAPFKAGSFISVSLRIDGSVPSRAYSLSSSPKEALAGSYAITVKKKNGGFVSEWLCEQAKVGDCLDATDPGGFMTHSRLRDASHVIALAGGVGITPFMSMAKAIAEGTEDFDLTILYGANKEDDLIFEKEMKEVLAKTDRVKAVYILANEEKPGFEHGFITADLIRKYAPTEGGYSIYASGPLGMLKYLEQELKKLNLEKKFIRMERTPETLRPEENKTYLLTVREEGEIRVIPARGDETVLTALERSGIRIRTKCHSGGCGECRCHLLKGQYKATSFESLRMADRENGWFNPCCSYPVSDMEIEINRW